MPTYEATDVVMKAIASVCKSGKTPSRSNVLAAIKTTNIPASANPLGHADRVHQHTATSPASYGYLFHINSAGKYVEIPPK